MKILYISYDGMLEPLGQSQVLSYQERLAETVTVHLLSFEKSKDWADEAVRLMVQQRMAAAGIRWLPRRYHKRPSAFATAYDILIGIITGLWVILVHRIHIIHARSYVAAVMALILKRLTGVKFVFDMRGFWADERVDGGLWQRDGKMYRVAKWFERHFLLSADYVVSLTHAAVYEMQKFDYLQGRMPIMAVIPTCADLDRFKPISIKRDEMGFVLGYVGSARTWYHFDEVVACFARLLRLHPNARFLIVNRGEHSYILERLAAAGVPDASIELTSATHAEVPTLMSRMDAGIFFYRPSFSRAACAPTKLAEFLGCGKPCLSNAGVGDMADVLENEQVGVVLKEFDGASMAVALKQLLALAAHPATSALCVAAAHKNFSLREGVIAYRKLYSALVGEIND